MSLGSISTRCKHHATIEPAPIIGAGFFKGVYELTMTIEQLDENTLHTYTETVMRDIEGTYHYHMKKR